MKDCAGGQHPDNEPVTWWQFERELAHRDRLAMEKERSIREAGELRARQMLISHRIVVVVISLLAIGFQILVYLRR